MTNVRPSLRFLQACASRPWAITTEKALELVEFGNGVLSGAISAELVAGVKAAAPSDVRVGSVAVLRLFGTVVPRGGMMTEISGATSAERFGQAFDAAMNDPSVGAVLLDVDSPGGNVAGVPELAAKVFASRGRKPIAAIANFTMASAAYWIGSAADEVIASPSAEVGSIGVLMAHVDETAFNERLGFKVTLISAGKHKTLGSGDVPLSEEDRAILQAYVDEAYDDFVGSVAKHRGVKPSDVRGGFGEGLVLSAAEAKKQGMVDRVETFDAALARLSKQASRNARAMGALAELEV